MGQELAGGRITLDQFLENDEWWEHNFKDTSQLPLAFLRSQSDRAADVLFEYDPYNKVVGHEKEKAASRAAINGVIKTYQYIRKRWKELSDAGFKENDPPGNCIIDIIREEVPPMPMFIRIGDYGSSKSLQQKCEEEFLFSERKKYGLTGYDYITRPDKESPLKFVLEQKSAPLGQEEVAKHFEKKARRSAIKKGLKLATILGAAGAMTAAFVDFIVQWWSIAQFFGYDALEWVVGNLMGELPYVESTVVIAGIPAGLALANSFLHKNESKDPSLLSTGNEMTTPYVGHETVGNLRGEYMYNLDVSPQFKLKLGDILKANEKIFVIENLHSLPGDVQKNLSQIIEEKTLDVADLPREYRKFVYTLISASINTEKLPLIIESLQNRINYADIQHVMNDITRDEEVVYELPDTKTSIAIDTGGGTKRNLKNERHLALLLADIVDRVGGRPWSKDAYGEFVDYCSRLADSSNELHISRRVIRLPKKAEEFAEMEHSPYVKPQHVLMAEKESKSITQLVMSKKLQDYTIEQNVSLSGDAKIGRVNVLLSYHDDLLKGMEQGTPKEIYDYIQTEDYVGYVVPINALAKRVRGKGSKLEIITKDKTIDRENLKNSLRALFLRENVDLDKYQIFVSVPSLKDDEAILGGAYSAVRSAVSGKPIRQDVCLAVKLSETGDITSLPRLNSRLFYLSGAPKVIVSTHDMKSKVEDPSGRSLYKDISFKPTQSLKELNEYIEGTI